MDNNNLSHVQVENKEPKEKKVKKYVIFHATAQEGIPEQQEFLTGTPDDVMLRTLELKKNGAAKVAVFQEVQLRVSLA